MKKKTHFLQPQDRDNSKLHSKSCQITKSVELTASLDILHQSWGIDQQTGIPQALKWENMQEYKELRKSYSPPNLTEPPPVLTGSAFLSNEAIIILHEEASKGVTLQREANYPSLFVISKHITRIRYQHAQGGQL